MCRMMGVVCAGAIDPALLARFRQQARGRAPPRVAPGHADGWGITYDDHGRAAYAGRSTGDALVDPRYEDALATLTQRAPSGVVLAHVRKASAGGISVENTHPFARGEWAFCHNGTVWGYVPEGQNDSQALFAFLLEKIDGGAHPVDALRSLVATIDGQHRYSSLTCLLTNGRTLWGMRKLGDYDDECVGDVCDPSYYTLGVAHVGDAMVVSQEREFLGLGADAWTPLGEGSVLQIDADMQMRVGRL